MQNWNPFSWEEFCSAAVSTRMNGIELYDIQGPVFQGKASPANPERAAGVRRKLIGQGLALPCISTVCDFTDPGFKREFSECLEVAVNLGISYLGVHTLSADTEKNVSVLREILDAVSGKPVTVVVETTGPYADTALLRDLLNQFSDDSLAACWDMYATVV